MLNNPSLSKLAFGLLLSLILPCVSVVASEQTLRVGIQKDLIPLEYLDTDGRPKGFMVDIWKLWSVKMQQPVEFVLLTKGEEISALERDQIDVISNSQSLTENSIKKLRRTQSIFKLEYFIFAHHDSKNLMQIGNINIFKIGINQNGFVKNWEKYGLSKSMTKPYQSEKELYQGLVDEEIQYCITSDVIFRAELSAFGRIMNMRQSVVPFLSYPLQAGINYDDIQLLQLLNSGLEKITPGEVQELKHKWMGNSIGHRVQWQMLSIGLLFVIAISIGLVLWFWSFSLKENIKRATCDLTEKHQQLKKSEKELKGAHDNLELKVTERTKDLQNEVDGRKKVEETLRLAKKEAELANMAKSEFLANISHELRTPMHHILSYSYMGHKRFNSPKDRTLDCFEKITSAGDRMMDLLNDLLDLSKLEAGKKVYTFAKNDILVIINETITGLTHQIKEKEIVIEVAQPTVPTKVICERSAIRQVVQNVLSNSIRFSEKNKKISISFDTKDVFIARRQNEQTISSLLVSIEDQGPGIPGDELESIFDRFIQSSKTKTGAGGTGLGLSICREIIEDHQGKIWAENNHEDGAIFNFVLPYAQAVV